VNRLDAIFDTALLTRVPRASWLVREGDRTLAAHQEERFYSGASMIKTFLLAAALELVERGEALVDQPIAVLPSHEAGGDGVLRLLDGPTQLPLRDLLALMTALSDNTATNAVLEAVGLEAFNRWVDEHGFESRMRAFVDQPQRAWSRRDEVGAGHDLLTPVGLSLTSAAEHDRLVGEIAAGRLLPALGPLALELLEEQQDRRALARCLPEDARFAHKTGTIGGVRHDAGLLRAGGREIRVSVFTDGGPQAEWVDHPALVGMGRAMVWCMEELGLDLELVPSTPPVPDLLVAPVADAGWDRIETVLRAPDVWNGLVDPEAELRFWREVLDGSDRWGRAILHGGELAGLVCLYDGPSPGTASIGVHVPEAAMRLPGVARAAERLAAEAARARGLRVGDVPGDRLGQ
jgi:beta-lactamase class A